MAGLKTVPSTRLLTDLNKKDLTLGWLIICEQERLDIKTLGRLACANKALRDVFYNPIFWRSVKPMTLIEPNKDVGCCLVARNIEFEYVLEIDMREQDCMAIKLLGLLENPMLSGRLKSLRLLLNYHDDFNKLGGFYTKAKSIAESESVAEPKSVDKSDSAVEPKSVAKSDSAVAKSEYVAESKSVGKVKFTFDNLCFLYVGIHGHTPLYCYGRIYSPKRSRRDVDANHIFNIFETLFPRMPQLTDLFIHHYYFTSTSPDLGKLVHDNLPQLKNLEYLLSDGVCFQQDQTIHTSVTNPKLERLSGYQTNIQTLAKTYPSLKHWSFGRFTRKVVEDEHDQSEVTMPTVQSVAITCDKSCSEHSISLHDINLSKLLAAFPNLLAIKADLWTGVIPGMYNYHLRDVLQKACPYLAVLDISPHKEYLPRDILTETIRGLKNLEVLVLPNRHGIYSNRIVDAITEHLPKIRSLIRLSVQCRLSNIPTLKYMTHNTNTCKVIVRNPDRTMLRIVRPGSNEWYEAHGTNYFYPESTTKFMDVIQYLNDGAM